MRRGEATGRDEIMTNRNDAGEQDRNRRIYETRYSAKNYARKGDDDVFGRLASTKLSMLRAATKPGDRAAGSPTGSPTGVGDAP